MRVLPCLFENRSDCSNIYDSTPFHRDPLGELVEAKAASEGISMVSTIRSAWIGITPARGIGPGPNRGTPLKGDMDEYVAPVAAPQVRELLTNYGPVPLDLVGRRRRYDGGPGRRHSTRTDTPTSAHHQQPPCQWRFRNARGLHSAGAGCTEIGKRA